MVDKDARWMVQVIRVAMYQRACSLEAQWPCANMNFQPFRCWVVHKGSKPLRKSWIHPSHRTLLVTKAKGDPYLWTSTNLRKKASTSKSWMVKKTRLKTSHLWTRPLWTIRTLPRPSLHNNQIKRHMPSAYDFMLKSRSIRYLTQLRYDTTSGTLLWKQWCHSILYLLFLFKLYFNVLAFL